MVTKTDMLISGVAKYVTEYRHAGDELVTIVKPRDNRIDFVWDSQHNLLSRRQKETDTSSSSTDDIVESWTYDASTSAVLTHTDPRGNTTTYTVDAAGNRLTTTHPTVTQPASQMASTSATYNSAGQLLTRTDEEGTLTQLTYFSSGSKKGLLQKVEVDPSGLDIERTFDYDAAGNRTSVTDPLGNTTDDHL